MKTSRFKVIVAGLTAGILAVGPALWAASTGTEREPSKATSVEQEATGEIQSIDAKAMTVTVKGVQTTTFKVTLSTQIVAKDKAKATFNDLKVGDTIALAYHESGSATVAERIEVREAAATSAPTSPTSGTPF